MAEGVGTAIVKERAWRSGGSPHSGCHRLGEGDQKANMEMGAQLTQCPPLTGPDEKVRHNEPERGTARENSKDGRLRRATCGGWYSSTADRPAMGGKCWPFKVPIKATEKGVN